MKLDDSLALSLPTSLKSEVSQEGMWLAALSMLPGL